MTMSRYTLLTACLVCALASACDEDRDQWREPEPPSLPPPVGTLVFDWSIEGRQDADACVEVEAVSFDAVIVDEGFAIGRFSFPCEFFEGRVNLYEDDFVARSALLDELGRSALGRIFEDTFAIGEGLETRLILDFPSQPVPMASQPDAGTPPSGTPDAGTGESPDPGTPPGNDTADAGASDAAAP
jgi:hypothetical protein